MAAVIIAVHIQQHQPHQLVKEFKVDYHKTDEHVPVNINIRLYNAPCSVVAIEYRDMMGQVGHDIDVKKIPLDSEGKDTDVSRLFRVNFELSLKQKYTFSPLYFSLTNFDPKHSITN